MTKSTPSSTRRTEAVVAREAIRLFLENRDKHGHNEENAASEAIRDFDEAEHFNHGFPHGDTRHDYLAPRSARAAPEHVCGLQGYNPAIDAPCPGCTVRRGTTESEAKS